MTLVLDIETVPMRKSLDLPYPADDRTPPANYKSDDAITKWRINDREAWEKARVKECSINPRLGRILCMGSSDGLLIANTEHDERALLEQAWVWLKEHRGQVVTWNGSFDLRFILIRSIMHGVHPTLEPSIVASWFRRYASFPHFDCKAVLTNWDAPRAGEGLAEWSEFFGLPGKTNGLSGADVWPMFVAGEMEKIASYCMDDVTATAAIYRHIKDFFQPYHASF